MLQKWSMSLDWVVMTYFSATSTQSIFSTITGLSDSRLLVAISSFVDKPTSENAEIAQTTNSRSLNTLSNMRHTSRLAQTIETNNEVMSFPLGGHP